MVLTIMLLAVLFFAGLISTFFYLPNNKICAWLQSFVPNNSRISCPTNSTLSSSPTFRKERSVYQKDELKKVFATFDKNGDGFITKQELTESLKNVRIFMTNKEIDDIVVKFDSNGDGLIDFDEFCLMTDETMAGKGEEEVKEGDEKEGEGEEDLREAFDVFDRDKDGFISEEELGFVLTSLGLREGKKMEDCKEMIRKVDRDGDGMVNFTEFKTMMVNGGKLLLAA